jgi:hypothetical protein
MRRCKAKNNKKVSEEKINKKVSKNYLGCQQNFSSDKINFLS